MKKSILVLTAFVLLAGIRFAYAAEPVNVGNKVCPVTGEKIDAAQMEPATYEHEGKVYNFCCSACIEKFKNEPQAYIEKVNNELGETKG